MSEAQRFDNVLTTTFEVATNKHPKPNVATMSCATWDRPEDSLKQNLYNADTNQDRDICYPNIGVRSCKKISVVTETGNQK